MHNEPFSPSIIPMVPNLCAATRRRGWSEIEILKTSALKGNSLYLRQADRFSSQSTTFEGRGVEGPVPGHKAGAGPRTTSQLSGVEAVRRRRSMFRPVRGVLGHSHTYSEQDLMGRNLGSQELPAWAA